MAKKTMEDMQKELEDLKKKYEQLVSDKPQTKAEKPPEWETTEQNIIKKEGQPLAYSMVQKQGNKKRIVMGSYARILKNNLKGEPKTKADGWIKTKVEVKGKKTDAYYVPMRKGHITLDPAQFKELSKGF